MIKKLLLLTLFSWGLISQAYPLPEDQVVYTYDNLVLNVGQLRKAMQPFYGAQIEIDRISWSYYSLNPLNFADKTLALEMEFVRDGVSYPVDCTLALDGAADSLGVSFCSSPEKIHINEFFAKISEISTHVEPEFGSR